MSHVLEIQKLKKIYASRGKTVVALEDVTFSVKKGEIVGLLGPNGAGKTTTINIIAGIVHKDGGSVKVFGDELSHATRQRMNVATAYTSLSGESTVLQNLRVFAKIYGVRNASEKIATLLRRFKMAEFTDKRFYTLSSGEKTRINICKGLINDPELLLLDEATVGLDPDIAAQVRDEIKRLDTTILFTSHNMNEVEELCARVAFLHKGRILRMGTPKELTKLIKDQRVTIDFYPSQKKVITLLKKLGVHILQQRDSRVTLQVPHADRKIHDILHPLLTQGHRIRDLTIEKPSLEEVFIHMARNT